MTWLIIVLVLAVAFGPVLYLLPNARDKRLTALREQARRLGLIVQMTSVPKLDPEAQERVTAGGKSLEPRQNCAAYKLPIGRRLPLVEPLLLLKIPAAPTVLLDEVVPGLALHQESKSSFWPAYLSAGAAAASVQQQLLAAIDKLPASSLGIAIDAGFVSCYWLEKSPAQSSAVNDIHAVLAGLRDDLCRRFGAAIE